MEAATAGNVSVINILFEAGADPFVVDKDGVTTLMSLQLKDIQKL